MSRDSNIACLDGLRGLACLLVFLAHASYAGWFLSDADVTSVVPGHIAVMVFFTLSGFLMAYHYWPQHNTKRYWAAYLIRRFFRVWPLFAVVITACALAYSVMPDPFLQFAQPDHVLNILTLMRPRELPFFWTVIVELKFYLLYALLAPLLIHLTGGNRYRAIHIVALLWIALLLVQTLLPRTFPQDRVTLVSYLAYFTGGNFAALCSLQWQDSYARRRRWWSLALVLLAAIYIAYMVYCPPPLEILVWNKTPLAAPLVALLLACIYSQGPVTRLLSTPFLRYCGTISYSLFLIHPFALALGVYYSPLDIPAPVAILLALLASLGLASGLYRAIERPAHRYGISLSKRL